MAGISKLNVLLAVCATSGLLLSACGQDTVGSAPSDESTENAVETSDDEDQSSDTSDSDGSATQTQTDSDDTASSASEVDTDIDDAMGDASDSDGSDNSDSTDSNSTDSDSTDSDPDSEGSGKDDAGTESADPDAGGSDASEQSEAIAEIEIAATMAALGIDPESDEGKCITANKDLIVAGEGAGDTVYVAAKCAPDEVAATISGSQTLGDLTAEESACVMSETLTYIASLPEDEARAAFNEDKIPAKYVAAIVPIAEEKCGVEAERFADEFAS